MAYGHCRIPKYFFFGPALSGFIFVLSILLLYFLSTLLGQFTNHISKLICEVKLLKFSESKTLIDIVDNIESYSDQQTPIKN